MNIGSFHCEYANGFWVDRSMLVGWLCWGLTSQSTIFQSCRDGAIASWVINQYFRGVKCLAQGHNTAAVGLEPRTSRSGVRHSTTEPPRSPPEYVNRFLHISQVIDFTPACMSKWLLKWNAGIRFLTIMNTTVHSQCTPIWKLFVANLTYMWLTSKTVSDIFHKYVVCHQYESTYVSWDG